MHRTAHRVALRRRLLSTLAGLAVVASMAFVAAAPVAAASLVVNDSLDQIADDGNCSLREAVQAANTDAAVGGCPAGSGADVITFAPAVTSVTLSSELTIDSDMTLGGPSTVQVVGNDTFRLIDVASGTSTLRDLVLKDGKAASSGGAVLVNSGASVTLQRLTISSSSAVNAGGGVAVFGALSVVDSTFSANSANTGGGAILIASIDTTVTVTGSTFSNNTSTSGGGAITAETAPLSVTRSTFTGNSSGANGGAIYCPCTALSLVDSTLSTNVAADSGGALFLDLPDGTTGTIRGSTFDANTATNVDGGAIAAYGAVALVNSTVWNNTAGGVGGGIWRSGPLSLTHATIAKNDAGDVLGGDGVDSTGASASASTIIRNTAIVGNGADWGNWAGSLVSDATVANSQIGLNGGALVIDQVLDPLGLQQNGGPTKTVLPADNADNPLLGGADTTICTTAPVSAKDQRGFGRTAPCDIGAVELDKTKPVVSSAKASLRRDFVQLSSTKGLRTRLSWKASDVDSGVDFYTIQRSVNGAGYTTIGTTSSKAFDVTTTSGTTYRFRIRAVDKEGNVGGYSYTPTITARLVQQSSSAVTFRGTWSTVLGSSFSGGSARKSSSSGASVTFSATGRSFAFISTVGARGRAKVYVDGSYVETIDLGGTQTFRAQVWSRTFSSSKSHTVRIVVSGTSGRPRIDADAFAVLR